MPLWYALLYTVNGHHYRTLVCTMHGELYRMARKAMARGERCCIATNDNGNNGAMYEKDHGLLLQVA